MVIFTVNALAQIVWPRASGLPMMIRFLVVIGSLSIRLMRFGFFYPYNAVHWDVGYFLLIFDNLSIIIEGDVFMNHRKMKYTYVGVDSHKGSHTAVFMDCFFEKLGEITFQNLPVKFESFMVNAEKFMVHGTEFLFGLEDTAVYGRGLAAFLRENGLKVKHVNAFLVARERKNRSVTQKTDSIDAECAARVLLSKFDEMPDVEVEDKYFVLRSLVVRRAGIVKNNIAMQNRLHGMLPDHYPNYREFFKDIDCTTALDFFLKYPSPGTLAGVTVEELARYFISKSRGRTGIEKARLILESARSADSEHQMIADMNLQSAIRQIQFNRQEIVGIEKNMVQFLKQFDCTLTTMTGIDTVCAAQMLSCIGDIRRFSSSAKLARYAGIAPVTYASGKKDMQFANQRGNRELNSVFYMLSLRVIMATGPKSRVLNHFFRDYYRRKISEGKTKKQALKCVQRRLVSIVWRMLTHKEEYKNPDMYDLPEEEENA